MALRDIRSSKQARVNRHNRISDRRSSRRPLLISSHPDADPEGLLPPETAVDTPTQDDFRRPANDGERPKPIVSINGNDVDEDEHREAA